MMDKKGTKTVIVWLSSIAAIVIAVFVLFSRTSLVEDVKRGSARVFDYEYIPNQHIDIDSCAAVGAADSIYKDFRNKFRFHYQTIAMASFPDSSRMLLLSDLPPHFDTAAIAVIFEKFTHRAEMRKHHIGYDGYTTDLVILLGNATQENCDKFVKQLDKEMYLIEYKPVVMTLPVQHERRYFVDKNTSIDYQITLDEFNTWFMEDGEVFFSLEDTSTVLTVSALFQSQARGVYFSRQPGFVAWAVAKNEDIGKQVGDIRQFALDADLILGALADSSTLVIIGRERQSPLYELPPLQVESILLLAATTEKELSQSLDINDLMAGKMNNGRDWCPTYLSRELENTEFGDLMTITDILLKDWSERGTIQEGYYRYPKPGYYPFDKPLFRKLGLNELVYNWNTADAMYAIDNVEFQDVNSKEAGSLQSINHNLRYSIYTLNRTGSLPVSYFNSQERSQSIGYKYERQAYHYFATLGNTDLARVVQYTALYQLFIDNNISYSGNTYSSFPKNKPFLLFKPTLALLDIIRHLDREQIAILADSISHRSFRSYQKERVDKQLRENEQQHNMSYTDENIDEIYHNVHRNTQASICNSIYEVKNMLGSLSEEQYKTLARYLSYPRGVTIRDRESYNTFLRARRVNLLMREMGKNNLDLLGMDLGKVKNYFSTSLSGNAGRYMKTSTLIVTFNDLLTTGGHNLSSRISRVNSMTNYKHSRGSFTPKDYEPPTSSDTVISKSHNPGKHKQPQNTSTTKVRKPALTPLKKTSVRSRSEVISNAPRVRRGF